MLRNQMWKVFFFFFCGCSKSNNNIVPSFVGFGIFQYAHIAIQWRFFLLEFQYLIEIYKNKSIECYINILI